MIISGKIDDDINLARDFNTEVYGSCAASLNDHMYVFGGFSHDRQVRNDCLKKTDVQRPELRPHFIKDFIKLF